MSCALVVFARKPEPGAVKTRLSPPFSPEQAAALYAAMLQDVLATTAEAAQQLAAECVLCATPADAVSDLVSRAPPGFRGLPQPAGSLGERMEWAVRQALAAGHEAVLLRGSDSPVLSASVLVAAREALRDNDLVAAPDRDGGYSLVGLRRPPAGVFDHEMGTEAVLRLTQERAQARGFSTHLLPEGFDIDRPADLTLLAAARAEQSRLPCPRTLALLDDLDLWRYAPGRDSRAG